MGALLSKMCLKPKLPKWFRRFFQNKRHYRCIQCQRNTEAKTDHSTQTSLNINSDEDGISDKVSNAIQKNTDINLVSNLSLDEIELNLDPEVNEENANTEKNDTCQDETPRVTSQSKAVDSCVQDYENNEQYGNFSASETLDDAHTSKKDTKQIIKIENQEKDVFNEDISEEQTAEKATETPLTQFLNLPELQNPLNGAGDYKRHLIKYDYIDSGDSLRIELDHDVSNFNTGDSLRIESEHDVSNFNTGDSLRIESEHDVSNLNTGDSLRIESDHDVSNFNTTTYVYTVHGGHLTYRNECMQNSYDNSSDKRHNYTYNSLELHNRSTSKIKRCLDGRSTNSKTNEYSSITNVDDPQKERCPKCQCVKKYLVKRRPQKESAFYRQHYTSPKRIRVYDNSACCKLKNKTPIDKGRNYNGGRSVFLPLMQNVSTLPQPTFSFPIVIKHLEDFNQTAQISESRLGSNEGTNRDQDVNHEAELPESNTQISEGSPRRPQKDPFHTLSEGVRTSMKDSNLLEMINGKLESTSITFDNFSLNGNSAYFIIPVGKVFKRYKVESSCLSDEANQTLQYFYQGLLTEKTVAHKSTETSSLALESQDAEVQSLPFEPETLQSMQDDKSTTTISETSFPQSPESVLSFFSTTPKEASNNVNVTSPHYHSTKSCDRYPASSNSMIEVNDLIVFNEASSDRTRGVSVVTLNTYTVEVTAANESIIFDRNNANDDDDRDETLSPSSILLSSAIRNWGQSSDESD